jgi:hypothetical protein
MIDNKGTIYSMRNKTLRGENTRKVGFTKRHVKMRLREANSETYSLPEWEVEFSKEVDNVTDVEKKIHSLLDSLGMRMYPEYPRKEFFQVPREIIKGLFDLVPGNYYNVSEPLPSGINLDSENTTESDDADENNIIIRDSDDTPVDVRDKVTNRLRKKRGEEALHAWNNIQGSSEYKLLSAIKGKTNEKIEEDKVTMANIKAKWEEEYPLIPIESPIPTKEETV